LAKLSEPLLKLVAPAQVLFGTDYPYRTGAEVIEGLVAQRFGAKELRAIDRDNAMRLLPQLKV
jgi:predicted TIM-barrel fold metal-dependent hydrolase